jgi:hypothetical protein
MATMPLIAKELGRISGIPASTLGTIARRLGESGLLPRGGRGSRLHQLTEQDCARLIIGAMKVADLAGSAARIDLQVSQVEGLQTPGEVYFAAGDSSAALKAAIPVVRPGSFLRQLESLIQRLGTDEKPQLLGLVAAVGLTTGANRTWGWVEPRSGVEFVHGVNVRLYYVSGVTRIAFGEHIDSSDFTREVRMTSEALAEIASLCHAAHAGARNG